MACSPFGALCIRIRINLRIPLPPAPTLTIHRRGPQFDSSKAISLICDINIFNIQRRQPSVPNLPSTELAPTLKVTSSAIRRYRNCTQSTPHSHDGQQLSIVKWSPPLTHCNVSIYLYWTTRRTVWPSTKVSC